MSSKQFLEQEVFKAFLKFPIDTPDKHKYINIKIKYINIIMKHKHKNIRNAIFVFNIFYLLFQGPGVA